MIDNLNGVNYDWEDIYQRWYGLVRKVKDGLEAGMVGVLLNFVLILLYCVCFDMIKERSIMWIDPRILSKIYEQRWFDNRYVGQRFYSSPVKQSFSNCLHDYRFDFGHLHHVINIGQAVLKEKEESVIRDSIMEVSFFEENLVKKIYYKKVKERGYEVIGRILIVIYLIRRYIQRIEIKRYIYL